MAEGRINKLTMAAAEATRQRIRRDRKKVSAQLWLVLDYIEAHLLDDELQVGTLWTACGIGDDAMGQRFAVELKKKPRDYIAERRMEVAARLLLRSDLTVWQIAAEVCYGSGSALARTFRKWGEQSPREYRRAPKKRLPEELGGEALDAAALDAGAVDAEESEAETLGDAAALDAEALDAVQLRALAGRLDEAEAAAMLERVESIRDRLLGAHPHLRPAAIPAPAPLPLPVARPVLGAEFVERSMAESLWRKIRYLPVAEQQATVRSQVAFSTPALYELLWKKCYDAAASGGAPVEIAELMHDSLELIAGHLGQYLPSYEARAWSTLGMAHHATGDFDAAELAFEQAEERLDAAGEEAHPVVVVQLCINKACLRDDQGEAEEAARLMAAATRVTDALLAHWRPEDGGDA